MSPSELQFFYFRPWWPILAFEEVHCFFQKGLQYHISEVYPDLRLFKFIIQPKVFILKDFLLQLVCQFRLPQLLGCIIYEGLLEFLKLLVLYLL